MTRLPTPRPTPRAIGRLLEGGGSVLRSTGAIVGGGGMCAYEWLCDVVYVTGRNLIEENGLDFCVLLSSD